MYRHASLLLLLALLTTGCGGAKTSPVSGHVKFKDGSDTSLLTGYEILFEPADGKASAVGHLRADGSFQLTTFSPDDGALPGRHRIAISPPLIPDKPPQQSKLDPKYANFTTSDLTAEIKPEPNTILLELEPLK